MSVAPTDVRDVVIVIPGIMGSELVDRDGRPLWSVTAGALVHAIRTFGRSIGRVELPAGIGDEAPGDEVCATGLLDSLHVIPGLWSPITGYDGLMRFLGGRRFNFLAARRDDPARPANLLTFPYDWRLSNRRNGRLLAGFARDALAKWKAASGERDAKLVLLCHSMGGLVARWFAECEGGAPDIRSIVTIGTPYQGAVKALDTLVNGLEPGIGPLRASLTSFVRSLPSLYQLLPQYPCIVTKTGRVDLATAALPELDPVMLADANAFHARIAGATSTHYRLYKLVGIRQPTWTTARYEQGRLVVANDIEGHDQGGDGTVPRHAAELAVERGHEVQEVADQHGSLQAARSATDRIDGILSRTGMVWQGAEADGFGVEMADCWSTHDEPLLRASGVGDRRLVVEVTDEVGRVVVPARPLARDDSAALGPLAEGGYRAVVGAGTPGGPTVVKPFVVIDPDGP